MTLLDERSGDPSGSAATLANPTTVNPTFVPDVAGAYVVGLVVNDGTFNCVVWAVIVTFAIWEQEREREDESSDSED